MEIVKYYRHRGSIDEISSRYNSFAKLKHARITASHFKWQDRSNGSISHHALAVFVGKTGYGKSSTINAFFGKSLMKTSDVAACTRECQSLDFELSSGCYFSLGDLPGIGESEYIDKKYIKMYTDFFRYSTAVVYVIRADTRDYSIDESAYKRLFKNHSDKKKVIFALNCCDKIEPINRSLSTEPSSAQMQNITKKIDSVSQLFQPVNSVIPYSAATGWNMNGLAEEIVRVVSNSEEVMISLS
jgi:small GTP-binding protein